MSAGIASSLDVLRQFAEKGRPQSRPLERCELCGTNLAEDHPHLVNPQDRKLVCACVACALLFGTETGSKYKRVPRHVRFLRDFDLSDAEWSGLMIPINLAFFFESSAVGKPIALYPSPAGATESQLPLDTWTEIVTRNPVLEGMSSDVEALLVNRLGPTRGYPQPEHYLLPIDECYKLVWLIRTHWRGLSGGTDVWKQLEGFLADLKSRSGEVYA